MVLLNPREPLSLIIFISLFAHNPLSVILLYETETEPTLNRVHNTSPPYSSMNLYNFRSNKGHFFHGHRS